VCVCEHWDVHCLLFYFIVSTNGYIVLVSMHFCNDTVNYSVRHFGYSFINHLFIELSKLSAASAVSLSVELSLNYSAKLVVTYHGKVFGNVMPCSMTDVFKKNFYPPFPFCILVTDFTLKIQAFLDVTSC